MIILLLLITDLIKSCKGTYAIYQDALEDNTDIQAKSEKK